MTHSGVTWLIYEWHYSSRCWKGNSHKIHSYVKWLIHSDKTRLGADVSASKGTHTKYIETWNDSFIRDITRPGADVGASKGTHTKHIHMWNDSFIRDMTRPGADVGAGKGMHFSALDLEQMGHRCKTFVGLVCRSLLPRSVEKRPIGLRLESEFEWHSKCKRLFKTFVGWICRSVFIDIGLFCRSLFIDMGLFWRT